MISFLERVAQINMSKERDILSHTCFIFPNKRSGTFFGKFLSEINAETFIMPHITTISDFIMRLTPSVEASRFEQLFILYDVYRELLNEKQGDDVSESQEDAIEFDQFQFWGDMIINDFNDVDKYLVDAKQLFINVKRLKEINSNYLTPEQIEIINKYWNENRPVDTVEQFWKHLDHESSDGKRPSDRFVKLWEILYELYEKFNSRLSQSGLSYSGRMYRDVAEKVAKLSADEFEYQRYVFIGFNVLSSAEIKIFDRLKDLGIADFYWDYNSPAYKHGYNKASRFLGRYVKIFKSKHDLEEPEITAFPEINVIGIPSNVGQVKFTGKILNGLVASGATNKNNAINTAVVLPDENLFVPMVNSFPDQFKEVNITMGYPMRFTSASALMRAVVSMHLRARFVKNECTYFYEDVRDVLSQPLMQAVAGRDCSLIQQYITQNRIFNIPAQTLLTDYPHLAPLFTPVKDIQQPKEVFDYAIKLVDYVCNALPSKNKKSLDSMFLTRYKQALAMLSNLALKYNITMQEHTFFHLIERVIASDTINFVGEPLNGLQIMGVLETRALDFDNIILLSMNERIFPRKHYSKSFIPESLRRGYGMSTIEFQESIYAYYFYRLLTRSKKVFLLYDARTSGVKSGDMSRYLYQLKYLYPSNNISFKLADYDVLASNNEKIEIHKTPEIMAKMEKFRTPPGYDFANEPNPKPHLKYMSASVIKSYLKCPLRFYFEKIEGIDIEDDVKEYMDDMTYGVIIHDIAENIYKDLGASGRLITSQMLDDLIADNNKLLRYISVSVNKIFNKLGDNNDTAISGEAEVLVEIMLISLKKMLEEEKKFTPIQFLSAEEKVTLSYEVNPDLKLNFTQIIDRLDRAMVDGNMSLRIVDYKTGSDSTSAKKFDDIFYHKNTDNTDAILQLLIYCVLYSLLKNTDEPIQPIIYKFRALFTDPLSPVKIGNMEILDYHVVKDEFVSNLNKLLEEIFDPTVPFTQTSNDDNCKYCDFKNICGRTPKNYNR